MLPHQERVVIEKDELNVKLNALRKFVDSDAFLNVDENEQERLHRQIVYMHNYSLVLKERIDNFKD